MWYYLKQTFLPFMYMIFLGITSFAVTLIEGNLLWLKIVLLILSLGFYVMLMVMIYFKEGQLALKARMANDLERKEIIRTGEDRPLKLKEEYKPWKGFFIGFLSSVPAIVLSIIHAVLLATSNGQSTGAGVIGSLLYSVVCCFFRIDGTFVGLTPQSYFSMLLAVPVYVLMIGIPYVLGARKIERQQERIREQQRKIYGDIK